MRARPDELVALLDVVGRSSFEKGRASARSEVADGLGAGRGQTPMARPEAEEQLRWYVELVSGRQVPGDVLTAMWEYGDVMEGAVRGKVHDPEVPWNAGSVANIPGVTVARVKAVAALEAATAFQAMVHGLAISAAATVAEVLETEASEVCRTETSAASASDRGVRRGAAGTCPAILRCRCRCPRLPEQAATRIRLRLTSARVASPDAASATLAATAAALTAMDVTVLRVRAIAIESSGVGTCRRTTGATSPGIAVPSRKHDRGS